MDNRHNVDSGSGGLGDKGPRGVESAARPGQQLMLYIQYVCRFNV